MLPAAGQGEEPKGRYPQVQPAALRGEQGDVQKVGCIRNRHE